ncbi:hypothetical protein [Legionella bononiensis]|uniref:Uncharacterized protein n=1 Tax=Legionella bononiensis TaxID=2793102 RepID=A0ABS1WB36_9GAMM|nr:hypothetical protein [Legionella bononiensis]MBL7480225.1 hypothetical protein [Legionella bononiensis]MBL7526543.1 hypothetical protein [Legionella bononiensis]MBL7562963.1 hypothetical protein [Legionella bononiensis]
MKNLITENYIIWLSKYNKTHAKNPKAQLISDLISDIEHAETLEQLISLFSDYPIPVPDESGHVYGPVNFYEQITGWKIHLESIKLAFPASKALLEKMLTSLEVLASKKNEIENSTEIDDFNSMNEAKDLDKTKSSASIQKSISLIRFLLDLINAPHALLNIRILSLLQKINNPDFPTIVTFLAHLDETPYPTNPRKGEFAAIPKRSIDHECCLHMLNNLAALNNSSNPQWDMGNGLLQLSLHIDEDLHFIDKDLHFEEISLDDDIPPKTNLDWCTLI